MERVDISSVPHPTAILGDENMKTMQQPPQGYHYMPNGRLMKNSNHLGMSSGAMMGPMVAITLIFGLFAVAGVVDQLSSS